MKKPVNTDNDHMETLKSENAFLRNELWKIYRSKSWKMIMYFRNIILGHSKINQGLTAPLELINDSLTKVKISRVYKILFDDYGLEKTIIKQMAVDSKNKPIPWYTYPTIEYLRQLDFSDKKVFEFGSGNSTLFWSSVSKSVSSVEHDKEWYESRRSLKRKNMKIKLIQDKKNYCESVLKEQTMFDVIIVDGEFRDQCAYYALKKLKPNGMIILDNTDWGHKFVEIGKAIKYLRKAGLIQVDFCGFGPINDYTSCTSVFLTRKFSFKSVDKHNQPSNIIGGIHKS